MDHLTFAQLLGNYGEFVGAIAVVATLFYLAIQVRHSKNATEANTRSLAQSRELAMNEARFNLVRSRQDFVNALVPYTGIWIRGNAGEPLDHVETEIYASFIRVLWGIAFWESQAINRLSDVKELGIHDFAAFLFQNPGARATWKESSRVAQEYRDRLLDVPGSAGVVQVRRVLEGLEKLRNDSSDIATYDDRWWPNLA